MPYVPPDPSATPVEVKGFQPAPFSIELLKTLEAAGVGAPVLFGGAVRDKYLGIEDKIKDYDIWADFGAIIDPAKETKDSIPQKTTEAVLQALPGATLKKYEGFDRSEETGFTAIKLILDYQGKEVSLFLNNRPETMDKKIQGDAPINAVAMDSSGKVIAHPLFEDHAKARLYAAFPQVPADAAAGRLAHLSEKIIGLHTPDAPQETPKPRPAAPALA